MTVPRRILVAVDGSAGADRALGFALELAEAVGASSSPCTPSGCCRTSTAGRSGRPKASANVSSSASKRPGARGLGTSPVVSRCLLVDGSPVPARLSTAAEVDADLIVVGSRGSGSLPGLLLGSTSRQLVEHADRRRGRRPAGDARDGWPLRAWASTD